MIAIVPRTLPPNAIGTITAEATPSARIISRYGPVTAPEPAVGHRLVDQRLARANDRGRAARGFTREIAQIEQLARARAEQGVAVVRCGQEERVLFVDQVDDGPVGELRDQLQRRRVERLAQVERLRDRLAEARVERFALGDAPLRVDRGARFLIEARVLERGADAAREILGGREIAVAVRLRRARAAEREHAVAAPARRDHDGDQRREAFVAHARVVRVVGRRARPPRRVDARHEHALAAAPRRRDRMDRDDRAAAPRRRNAGTGRAGADRGAPPPRGAARRRRRRDRTARSPRTTRRRRARRRA